jgi:hypothetical protein
MTHPFLQTAVAAALATAAGCVVEPGESPLDFGTDPAASRPPGDDGGDRPETDAPAPMMIGFVTSLEYTADLGGLVGADEICSFEAEGAELPGSFRAWLSATDADAIDRIAGDGPWHDVTGQRLFNNHSHLRSAPLTPIIIDPFGDSVLAGGVWTGTGVGGRLAGGDTCGDWTTEDPFRDAATGYTVASEGWTDSSPAPCTWEQHLYCLQVQ